ncbi:methyl-accepting chemotaxis protein [Halomonas campaniensis]|uniref:Methyl-accepting chemotaxis protein n=1 Tax=Halomonas campaniensis TaxID=213554 RepID=A0A7W5P9P9_9GAMM|nr:methyl-accepting chemotaxis protein [Halomonas campaniensis]MBB3329929.1 methyl-accepting chemotaxis protein [Halomonas campaniensis]
MRHLLHRIPMGRKFLLTLLLPLLALAWFAGSGILERQRLATNMAGLETLTALSRHAGNLVHELQRERGMSSGFIGSRGEVFGNRLSAQRTETDRAIGDFREALAGTDLAALDADLARQSADIEQRLAATTAVRQQVQRLETGAEEAVAHYTGLNDALMGMVGRVTHLTADAGISRRLGAYFTLLKAKDLAGVERALLANAFSANLMRTATHQRLLSMLGQEGAYLKSFRALANAEMRDRLSEILAGEEVQRVLPLRQIALERGVAGGYNVDPQQWFDWQTAKINRLKALEDAVAEGVLDEAAGLRQEARQELVGYLVITLVAAGLAILFAVLVVQSIVRSLRAALDDIESRGGDLTRRLAVPGSDELSRLYRAFNASTADTEQLVANIRQGALSVEVASGEIAQGNQDLAQRTEEQSASLVETASSMEQITATVRQTADNAQQARSMTDGVAGQAREASDVAAQAQEAMQQIHAANQEVTSIVAAIDNIAFQTNLLALNASVEAARAGEHGRGFAVVAQEVRKLASRSAEEASQIRRLIDTNVARIDAGEQLVSATSDTLQEITRQVAKVAELVADMSSATTEQSAGIEQINQAVAQLEEVTQQNAALVEQVAAASRSLDDQATDMAGLIGHFKVSEAPQTLEGLMKPRQAQAEFA